MEAENDFTCTPPDIRKAAQEATENLLPAKSKPAYEKAYQAFTEWCRGNGVLSVSENVLLALYLGYAGACRRDEITNMSTDDVDYKEDTILVRVPKTKTNVARLFVITDAHWLLLIKKYANLRPCSTATKRFFLTYRNGRCTTSPIGINSFIRFS
ncbi:hypothetical protein PPYR_01419 [Photinus pyralis]|uniref:Tyr recombinase domain-containing protein n=1 Tax=Photinus pyralis TaxID=7054 RepID=A0A5N4B4A1_PHOPY|nr:hypothetical protein PPYR_01419 [Photinus pyralis]